MKKKTIEEFNQQVKLLLKDISVIATLRKPETDELMCVFSILQQHYIDCHEDRAAAKKKIMDALDPM